eukprot:gene11641-53512_t
MGEDVAREGAEAKAKKNAVVDACRPSGTSNCAARERGRAEYKSHEWKDARLTQRGRGQALDVASYIEHSSLKVELMLVSPLRRAAETAVIGFDHLLRPRVGGPRVPFVFSEPLRE